MLIIGVDEAGRGPLAGPVCAAAVVLDGSRPIEGLADSKKLSSKKRERLSALILSESLGTGLGWASVEEIDELNILRASLLAMTRAVESCLERLVPTAYEVLIDGPHSPSRFKGPWQWTHPTRTLIGGDALEPAISAASILAKVARDALMKELDTQYPGYGFAGHAGYGTAAHLAALRAYGPCPAHRKTFAPVAALCR